ncbi:HlyD family secretion protein [Carboxylicivirga linearis]|uniref:Efflux RND transporter periplasmic adaptor subunit n=1 Tax=Carboxylicivirga linearis TaxID=1628157 RepID=A0ABS5JXM3_9BACT|nr:efflux RND transporter periplasmic adaptor subunit [Carboxylicivirga linearis]MBS2099644.1 efflux RND transporter periplasmic adaptor subunit [Carboxylicivirga linearis]
MNKKAYSLLIILAALLLITICGWFFVSPDPVLIRGEVDAKQVSVATKIVGRVSRLDVEEGQQVKKGDTLMIIDSPEVYAKLMQAEAAKAAATAQSNKAQKGARDEQIQAAKSVWEKAKAASDLMEKTFERIQTLYEEGVVPAQKRDEVETQMKAAQLTAKAAESQYVMAKNGARTEDKSAAAALVNQADGAVTEVESYIKETEVIAGINGQISTVIPNEGELVTPGLPVVTITDLSDAWVTFNIREDWLPKVKQGSQFPVTIPALGMNDVMVEVTFINSLGSFATNTATKSVGDYDLKTFEVRMKPVKNIDGLLPGMSVIVNSELFQ